jgi:hypothetical protein
MRASRLEETRFAENGRFYTRDAFMHHYGQWRGPAEWDRARVCGWDRTHGEAANAGGDTEIGADVIVGSAVEPAIEYADSRGALSDEARALFRQLHRQVADEEQAGGPRTRFTILQNFITMTTDELETCISLYYRSKASPSDASAEPAPPEQRVGVGGCPLGNHGYPLRPNSEPCAFYDACGKCDYGEECRYDHPEYQLAELLQAQGPIPPPPPTDDEDGGGTLIPDDSADETPPPTENAANTNSVYCEDGNARANADPEKNMQSAIASESSPDLQRQGYMGMPDQHPEERVPPTYAAAMDTFDEMQWHMANQQIVWSQEAVDQWCAAWQWGMPSGIHHAAWQQYHAEVVHVRMNSWR